MRRVLLIFLSLVLALVGWSAACAEDGFYVIGGGGKSARVPKTGQTHVIYPRDDGGLQKGVAWPTPRFTDNNNGTVTDKLTKLIWMKKANAFSTKVWADALTTANTLASGSGGLNDGSKAGDWRLPNIRELQSLAVYADWSPSLPGPAVPDTLGTGRWTEGDAFQGVQSAIYWSSTTVVGEASLMYAWYVNFMNGQVAYFYKSSGNPYYVWCVRAGP